MTSDEDAVIATALDYFMGWYDADLTRMRRALHSALVKRSFGTGNGEQLGPARTKEWMLEQVAHGGGIEDRTEETFDVEVSEIYHDIATAIVRSAQYREYLHLVRTPTGWKIVNAFWRLTEAGS